ncbi:MAG TPA: glutamate--cysteine ligase [Actinomycetaceae bacterium]|nr:glutamate--cysteine ligase [Actinomycetaceae bacterium]
MTLSFAPSERSTVGIEWELQLVDEDSLDLRQCAATVLRRVERELGQPHPNMHHELLLNTIELVSDPSHTVGEAISDIETAIEALGPVLNGLGVVTATAGTHPFANPLYQRVTNKERYSRLVDRTRYWGQQMLLFGMHVHVGIEARDKVLPILNAMLTRHAHLQSLAASSPFWSNKATFYACNRAMMFQQLPTAGLPHRFDTWSELERYTEDITRTGVIEDFSEVRWDIRPSPRLGTIEVRVCDAPTNVTELRAISALIHCLVEYYSRLYDSGERLPSLPQWFIAENKWRSARYGMDAVLILNDRCDEELVTDTVAREIELLKPIAEDLGCADELALVQVILDRGAGYQRQFRAWEKSGGHMETVVRLMVDEFKLGRPI